MEEETSEMAQKFTMSVRSIFKLVMFCVTTTRTCDEQKISTQSRKKNYIFYGKLNFNTCLYLQLLPCCYKREGSI